MRKLLNTLYVTNENIYMTLDGENVVCKENNEVKLRLPFSNIEAIFGSRAGCVTRKCVAEKTSIRTFFKTACTFKTKYRCRKIGEYKKCCEKNA